ncbi:hypothetical protein [Noviherbaspirillum aridicola]|uniref:Hemerythrin HHE cation binding domain-containing protein n=1 Tax=Noviherbaspirillum aridicola TaxID=2849687 RepID=A0ABQ4Q0U4_9BURK|nr:hypothetical protein [Noviherbaspirillum aridicola]GIZ50672.1 hypothetical protein NCCP691_06860 [Noviherbaspirillum aridicola]
MLTSTYSLVAITAEQERSRGMLARLRQHFQNAWKGVVQADFGILENACQRLMQFDNFFRCRKIDTYLVPVMRMMGREAQSIVSELESLAARAAGMLDRIRQQLRSADTRAAPDAMRDLVSGYCDTVSLRLDREEHELLPLSRRLLSVEDWFSIAARMLADDGGRRGRAPRAIILPRGVSPAAQRALGTR